MSFSTDFASKYGVKSTGSATTPNNTTGGSASLKFANAVKAGQIKQIEPVKIEQPVVQPKQNIIQRVGSFVGNLLQKSTAKKQVEEKLSQPTPTFTPTTEIKPKEIITQPKIAGESAQLTPEVKTKVSKITDLGIDKLKTVNEKSKVVLKEIAKRTSGTGIVATIKSASPEVTFQKAYEVMRKSQQEKDDTLPEQFVTGLLDSAPQTAFGIALGFVPIIGTGLATSYWAAVSAGSEIEEKGYATPTNVAIDVIGDRILGGMVEKLFKTPAKSLLKIIKKSFVVEGGTEVAQDLLKFANDYRLAKTDEERTAIIDKAKNYFTSGQILVTAGVGGISGAGIATVATGVNKLVNVNTFSPQDIQDSLSNSTLNSTEEKDKVEALIKEATDKNTQIVVNQDGKGDVVITTPEGEKIGLSLSKNQTSGLSTGTPSNKIVAPNLPDTSFQEPSLKTENLKPPSLISSIRYISPSQRMNLDDNTVSIQDKVTTMLDESQKNLKPFSLNIEEATGIKPDVRVKTEDSLKGKIDRYQLKNKKISEISDVLAGKVETTIENIPNIIQKIKDNFETIEVENYFDNPSDWGYRGVNIRVKLPTGSFAEIQIHTKDSWIKTKQIHKLYEKWRNIDLSKISNEQKKELESDRQESLRIANEKSVSPESKPSISNVNTRSLENNLTELINEIDQEIKGLGGEEILKNKSYANYDQVKALINRKYGIKDALDAYRSQSSPKSKGKTLTIKEAEQVKDEAIGKAQVATERRASVNENNIALAKRVVNSRAYQENDIEYVRKRLNTEQNQRIDDIVEDARNANGKEMTETEAIEYVAGLPTKAETKVKLPEEYKTFVKKRKKTQLSQDNKILKSRVFERLKAENESLTGEAEINAINLDKDAERAVRLIAKDKQKAFNIAMGFEVSDKVTSTSVNIAMAEKALQDGNTELYERLVKNRSLSQTRRGQEIVAEKGSVSDNSTSKYVKELISARLDQLGKRYLGDLTTEITKQSNKDKAIKLIDNKVDALETKIKNKKLGVKDALLLLEKLKCV